MEMAMQSAASWTTSPAWSTSLWTRWRRFGEVCLVAYTLAIREDRAHTTTITILVIKRIILKIIIIILLHEAIIITEAARQEIREMLAGVDWGIQYKLL